MRISLLQSQALPGYIKGKDISSNYTQKQIEKDFNLVESIMEEQGFNGFATIVSTEELDSYIRENGTPDLYRGASFNTEYEMNDHAERFSGNDNFLSTSRSCKVGRGVYTTDNPEYGIAYANQKSKDKFKVLLRTTLNKDAKIYNLTRDRIAGFYRTYGILSTNCTFSNLIASKGYDVIRVNKSDTCSFSKGDEVFYVILNRTVMITDKENYYK